MPSLRPSCPGAFVACSFALALGTFTAAAHAEDRTFGLADPLGAQGLYADVERIVSVEETASDWFLDEQHQTTIGPTVARSVCQSSVAAREEALRLARGEVARLGDAEALYRQAGRKDKRVDEALHAARVLSALERGVGAAASCPFWVRPQYGFVGRQRDVDRLSLSVESGGVAQIRSSGGEGFYGGGGGLRLLPGWAFGRNVKLLVGAELGGGALVRFRDSSKFALAWFPAIPALLRIVDGSFHYDLETGLVGYFTTDDTRLSYGVRVGGGIGISALRTRSVIPWAGPAISYEYLPASGGRDTAHVLRGGLRVGIVWDPFVP
jgi:hypothetical protein